MLKLKYPLIASLLLSTTVHASPTLLQDTYTSNTANQVNLNFGGSPSLNVATGKSAFLKFAITSSFPLGTTGNDVAKATLKLFANSVKGAGSFNVYTLNSPWTESGVKSGNQPAQGTLVADSIPITNASYQQYITIDITNQVKDWLDNPNNNNGLSLVTNNGLSVFFDSKENTTTSHAPEIEVSLVGSQGALSTGASNSPNYAVVDEPPPESGYVMPPTDGSIYWLGDTPKTKITLPNVGHPVPVFASINTSVSRSGWYQRGYQANFGVCAAKDELPNIISPTNMIVGSTAYYVETMTPINVSVVLALPAGTWRVGLCSNSKNGEPRSVDGSKGFVLVQ